MQIPRILPSLQSLPNTSSKMLSTSSLPPNPTSLPTPPTTNTTTTTLPAAPAPAPAPTPFIYSTDALFKHIEQTHLTSTLSLSLSPSSSPTSSTTINFGKVLDAGTGIHSLRWLADLEKQNALSRWTAVTADESMRSSVAEEAINLDMNMTEGKGEVVIGNWASTEARSIKSTVVKSDNGQLLINQKYDTVLCDYLIGAIDGFSPYYQEHIFTRLLEQLEEKSGGRVYVVGLNPIPDCDNENDGKEGEVVCKVQKIRDACILLAGHRCYREYPIEWIETHLISAGLKIISSRRFPILYNHTSITRQINVARSKLSLFECKELRDGMKKQLDELESEAVRVTEGVDGGRIKLGFDYVVCAEKV